MAKKNTPAAVAAVPATYVPSLKTVYKEEIVPQLMKQFGYSTVMQCPKLVKITINEGVGDATGDKKLVETAAQELSIITGQKAVITHSRKDISNFKLSLYFIQAILQTLFVRIHLQFIVTRHIF